MGFPAVWAISANSLTAETFRQATSSLLAGTGVVGPGDLAVTANSTPNMSVNVAPGQVWIPGTLASSAGFGNNFGAQPTYGLPGQFNEQGCYYGWNNTPVNVQIAAANPTNPRIDIICAYVQDAQYSGSSNSGVIGVITGTPSPSPTVPSAPASAVVLAGVYVAANVTSITQSNINDQRPFARLVAPANTNFQVYLANAVVIPNMSTTVMPYDTVSADTASGWSAATHTYTIPAGESGLWLFSATMQWAANSTGTRGVSINGNVWHFSPSSSDPGSVGREEVSYLGYFTAGQTANVSVYQSSGGALNTGSGFPVVAFSGARIA
jgi:hypothetical protein